MWPFQSNSVSYSASGLHTVLTHGAVTSNPWSGKHQVRTPGAHWPPPGLPSWSLTIAATSSHHRASSAVIRLETQAISPTSSRRVVSSHKPHDWSRLFIIIDVDQRSPAGPEIPAVPGHLDTPTPFGICGAPSTGVATPSRRSADVPPMPRSAVAINIPWCPDQVIGNETFQ